MSTRIPLPALPHLLTGRRGAWVTLLLAVLVSVGLVGALRGAEVLNDHGSPPPGSESAQVGAAGYLLKDADPADIVAAIQAAARGETVLGPQLTSRVVAAMRVRRAGLSARELEVLGQVAHGLSNRDIAGRLVVSEATVKTHLNHVFGKLGVDNRTAAVAAARGAGLLD